MPNQFHIHPFPQPLDEDVMNKTVTSIECILHAMLDPDPVGKDIRLPR